MVIEQESNDKPATGEGTPAQENNETPVSPNSEPADEAVTQEEEETKADTFVSGAKKARKLGESRRKLAHTLLKEARKNPEIRETVKQMITEDPDLDKYFRKSWPDDHRNILSAEYQEEEDVSIRESEEQIKTKARMEILAEQIREDKFEQAYDLAFQLGFTTGEAEALKDLALKLEGQKIAGEELTYEEALKRAAYTVRPDRMRASNMDVTSLPSGTPQVERPNIVKQQKNDMMVEQIKRFRGDGRKNIEKSLSMVEKNLRKDGSLVLPTSIEE